MAQGSNNNLQHTPLANIADFLIYQQWLTKILFHWRAYEISKSNESLQVISTISDTRLI